MNYIDSKTGLLGLFGNPSSHSLSPIIQNHILKHYGLNYVYLSFEPEPEKLEEAFKGAVELGIYGLNVTMPFKEKIIDLLDKTSGNASIIGAVNTVKIFHDGLSLRSEGFNTDGEGVISSIEREGFDIWDDLECLVLGAGGAARSAIFSILSKPVKKIFIFDILKEKAKNLISDFKSNIKKEIKNNNAPEKYRVLSDDIDKKIMVLSNLDEIEAKLRSLGLIINCTPAGMDIPGFKNMLPIPESWDLKEKYIFDMVYKPVETRFITKAKREKAAGIITGIDQLVNQGVHSFNIWFNIMPEDKVIKEVKNSVEKLL